MTTPNHKLTSIEYKTGELTTYHRNPHPTNF